MLCQTEAALRQHQASVEARLQGGDAPEPAGCHLVPRMVGITIVERHGPASTEVRVTGASAELGWTDALLPANRPQ